MRDIGEKVSDLVWGERTEIVAVFDHLVPTVYKENRDSSSL